jgi:hypothetical protein
VRSGVARAYGLQIQHAVLRRDDQRDKLRTDIGHDVALGVPGEDFEMGDFGGYKFGKAEFEDGFGFRICCHFGTSMTVLLG